MQRDKKEVKIPLMYLFIFSQMTKKFGKKDRLLPYRALLEVWHRNVYNVPKKYYTHFIAEMCSMGLLEQLTSGRRQIQYKFYGYTKRNCLTSLGEFFLW